MFTEDLELEYIIHDERLIEWGFPHRGSVGAASIDLHACIDNDLRLHSDTATLISTGFSLHIGNSNWVGFIAPRSGLGNRGLVLGNLVGIVDSDYTGEICVSLWNRNAAQVTKTPIAGIGDVIVDQSTPMIIKPGDRIAQMFFVRISQAKMNLVEQFTKQTERGSSGFGSTGVKA